MNNAIPVNTIRPLTYEPSPPAASSRQGSGVFSQVLHNAVSQVEALQADSDQRVSSLFQGTGAEVQDVMIAIEKADVAFQLMMQVRNKIVNAYQQVSQMQF